MLLSVRRLGLGSNDKSTTISAILDLCMRRVVFLTVPPIQILDLTGPFEVFARCGGYKVEVASYDSKETVQATCGLTVGPAIGYRKLRGAIDTLLVVGGEGVERGVGDEQLL